MIGDTNNQAFSYAGLPYEDINWYDVQGQPFGIASYFNVIVFEDANNIVDTKGAMAVGGSFYSPRGLTLGYGNKGNLVGTGYSPDFVRFLVGRNVAMQGPLVVVGHVVAGGNFRAAGGSTYMIGKDGSSTQLQELTELYRANGGSQYWRPSDRGSYYAISSYDVPRYIPGARIGADVAGFFADARESITNYHRCITSLTPNGTVTERFHQMILRGSDPVQNVFVIDVRPNGILNKEIVFEIPENSLGVVILRTGNNAHLQYGLWGSERHAKRTLYVFEDATNIYMEVPAAIWGSILAPQAMFHAHQTGGNVNGNAVFKSFAVNAGSGFEFHLYNFVGGVVCPLEAPPVQMPEEIITVPVVPECPPCPQPEPCPVCPPQQECPQPPPCPPQQECPQPPPCPPQQPCPEPEPCPECPPQLPCPECPPCPVPEPCPECKPCPEPIERIEYVPYPVRVPIPYTKTKIMPMPIPVVEEKVCPKCQIIPGMIFGCIWGCECCCSHDFDVKLYRICDERKSLLYSECVSCCGCFEFTVDYDCCYLLEICSMDQKKMSKCKPVLTLKNVGVSSLMVNT